MRRVATALGTAPASLYRYVATREQLLDLMVDAVGAEYDLATPPSGDWLADLLALAHQVRAVLRRHPWLPGVLETRPAPGPNGLRFLEAAVRAMRPLPAGARTKLEAAALLVGVTATLVRAEQGEADRARRVGVGPEELARAQADYLRSAVRPDEHPELTRLLAEPAEAPSDVFDRVVGRVLAGLLEPGR
jgi:AcrR family transcriptional regulator